MTPPPTPSPPPSEAASPSPKHPITDDDKRASSSSPEQRGVSPDLPTPATRAPVFPAREDCWSEDATRTLIDAWGSRYLELNRGNLRQKDWQEVADAVNAVHGTSVKLHRTDVQCKNRIDTIKKKYKIERSKAVQSNGRYVSTWPHFLSLDSLIGDSFSKINNNYANGHSRNLRRKVPDSPELTPPPPSTISHLPRSQTATNHLRENDSRSGQQMMVPWPIPVGPRSKRSGAGSVTERNFSVMAAAAAAMEAGEDGEDDGDSYDNSGLLPAMGRKRKLPVYGEGFRVLADAISRLGNIYQKVEEEKQRQIMELEKQKMQFAMDLEIQRMKIFMESQVRLEKLKRRSENNSYL